MKDQLAVDSSMYSLSGTLDSISYILDFGSEQFHRPNTPARPWTMTRCTSWADGRTAPDRRNRGFCVYEWTGNCCRVPGDTWGLESLVSTSPV